MYFLPQSLAKESLSSILVVALAPDQEETHINVTIINYGPHYACQAVSGGVVLFPYGNLEWAHKNRHRISSSNLLTAKVVTRVEIGIFQPCLHYLWVT